MRKKLFHTICFIAIIAFISCNEYEDDRAVFNDPGFVTTNYQLLPTQQVSVEAVVINTPSGFKSIEVTLTDDRDIKTNYLLTRESINDLLNVEGLPEDVVILIKTNLKNISFTEEETFKTAVKDAIGDAHYEQYIDIITEYAILWSGEPVKKPEIGNISNGYAKYIYRAPLTDGTAIIEITITEQDGTQYTQTITIEVTTPEQYTSIGQFLQFSPQYDDLYTIAQKSDRWTESEDDDGNVLYGLSQEACAVTFFAVPDGSFNDLIENNPHISSVDEIDAKLASTIIKSLILGPDATLESGSRAIPYDKLSTVNVANLQINTKMGITEMRGWGCIAYDLENQEAGQVKKGAREFISRCSFVQTDIQAGASYVHALDGHYSDIKTMDGSVEPVKTWRADIVLSALGWSEKTKDGMNALTGRRYHGSGYWNGVLFVPLDDLVTAAYDNLPLSPEWADVDTWSWDNHDAIAEDDFNLVMDFWHNHNVEAINKPEDIVDGEYTTRNEKTLTISNEGTQVSIDGHNAKILQKIQFFDGGSDVYKTIVVIDAVLY